MNGPDKVAVWFQDEDKVLSASLSPGAWRGELDCWVGPFSSRKLAQNFVTFQVDFDPDAAVVNDIFVRGDAWYVELRTLHWS